MGEKVLGFYEKDAGITCAKCYCVYCDEAKCPAPDCGEVNKEDIIIFNRSELVPVRLKSESVDLKWLGREFAKRKYMSKDGVMVIDCYPLWRKIQDMAEKEAKKQAGEKK